MRKAAVYVEANDVAAFLITGPEGHIVLDGGYPSTADDHGEHREASEASAYTIASGGDDPDMALPLRALIRLGIVGYPPARVDHRSSTEIRFASDHSYSSRTSPAAAPRDRSASGMATASWTS